MARVGAGSCSRAPMQPGVHLCSLSPDDAMYAEAHELRGLLGTAIKGERERRRGQEGRRRRREARCYSHERTRENRVYAVSIL